MVSPVVAGVVAPDDVHRPVSGNELAGERLRGSVDVVDELVVCDVPGAGGYGPGLLRDRAGLRIDRADEQDLVRRRCVAPVRGLTVTGPEVPDGAGIREVGVRRAGIVGGGAGAGGGEEKQDQDSSGFKGTG